MIYRREIDGLRAVAVIPVILFHAGFSQFSGGYVGVDVFFVISGYLITSIILHEQNAGSFSFVKFYERRARRILPALILILVVTTLVAWLIMTPHDLEDFFQSLLGVATFSSNIVFWLQSGYFDTAAEFKPLLHTWSLAIEEQYYLLFPLFMLITSRLRQQWVVLALALMALASLTLACLSTPSMPSASFFLLPTRAWELLIGILLAYYLANQPPNDGKPLSAQTALSSEAGTAIGLALIFGAVLGFKENTPVPSLYTLMPTIGTALIILFANDRSRIGRLLGHPVLVGIGLISYSAYLWHQPLFAFARYVSLESLNAAIRASLIIATLGLAYLSWRFVERPFRSQTFISRKHVFALSGAVIVAFATIGAAGRASKGMLASAAEPLRNIYAVKRNDTSRNSECFAKLRSGLALNDACRLGVQNRPATFALFGDSHAASLVRATDAEAKRAGLTGLNLTLNSCFPVMKSRSETQDNNQKTCNALRARVYGKLTTNELPPTVILVGRWTSSLKQIRYDNGEGGVEFGHRSVWLNDETETLGYFEALKKDILQSVDALLASGRKVILVYPFPEAGWDVLRRMNTVYLHKGLISPSDASTSYDNFLKRNAEATAVLDGIPDNPRLVRIRPTEAFCNSRLPGRCVTQIDGQPLYFDDNHLSTAGATLLMKQIISDMTQ